MLLCFGTFATVLNICREGINSAPLVARIARCVDSTNSCIGINRFKENGECIGDGPNVTKLLKCKRNFTFDKGIDAKKPTADEVIDRFRTDVTPYINEDKKAKAILTLLDIIKKDKIIDFENKEEFKKFCGKYKNEMLQQEKFEFSDFMGKLLIYTTYSNVKNTDGQSCVQMLTQDYIDKVTKPYVFEYKWDGNKDILDLLLVKIYNIFYQTVSKYKITEYICNVDPTNYMDDIWLERWDDFLKDINNFILKPYCPKEREAEGFTFKKIQEFSQKLDDYTSYTGINMIFASSNNKSYFVPKFREENVKWATCFQEETMKYRKQLSNIAHEIYCHMLFAEDTPSDVSE